MELVLIGASGAGKGTQAKRICEKYKIPHISTGDILRNNIKNKTDLGLKIKSTMDNGKLVSDNFMLEILKNRISEDDCINGFVLDGFPRTIFQAKELEKITNIFKAIYINVEDSSIIKRLTGRRICKDCGAMYNIEYSKPNIDGICDVCCGILVIRKDDEPDTVIKRIETFHKESFPIIKFYKDKGMLIEVDGEGDISTITKKIFKLLGE